MAARVIDETDRGGVRAPAPTKRTGGRRGRGLRAAAAFVVAAGLAVGASSLAFALAFDPEPETELGGEIAVTEENREEVLDEVAQEFPLPEGEDLDYLVALLGEYQHSMASFRSVVGYNAACLWYERALSVVPLTLTERAEIEEIPEWPTFDEEVADVLTREAIADVSEAVLEDEFGIVSDHVELNCDR